MDSKLSETFYDINNNAFLASADNLHKELRNGKLKISKKKLSEWLTKQDIVQLHKKHTQSFGRNHYIISAIDQLWEMDLCSMISLANVNDGFKYILTVIDVFSKFAFARPVKNKTALEIFKAFRDIIVSSGRKPKRIQSDLGLEFKNKIFQNYCTANNIQQNFPQIQSQHKCAVIERFNRTLKGLLFKYFSFKGPGYRKYIDVLQRIIDRYNNTFHSTIKMRPNAVTRKDTVNIYRNTRMRLAKQKQTEVKFLYVGNYVRIIKKKDPLEHQYTERWTREVFQVKKVIDKKPFNLYILKDLKGNEISGKFYYDQLQKINLDRNRIVKIIKSRGIGYNTE